MVTRLVMLGLKELSAHNRIPMTQISNFPDDQSLWMVKWIDCVRLAHLSTKTASISILLQKLSIRDPKSVSSIAENELKLILSPTEDTQYKTVRVLIGDLPEIEIGDVFQSKAKVARLPSKSFMLTLPFAESSCESRSLSDLDPPPYQKWDRQMPYRVLNNFEYFLDKKQFHGSNFLIHKSSTTDYIIPKSLIFKTFYAQNRKFALAFTNGNWPTQLETLVCTKELESGLMTGIDETTGAWNIVLQLKVPIELTGLIGIYLFDEYGQTCASSIYSSMLQSRNNNQNDAWFIDAKIPFTTTPNKPLQLALQGFELRRYAGAEEGKPVRVLVTRILGCSLPPLPQLNQAFVINGQQAQDQVKVDAPAPFTNHANIKAANEKTTLDSNLDSNPSFGTTEIFSSSFSWIDPPEVRKMQKTSSKSYNKLTKQNDDEEKNLDIASSGNSTSSNTAHPEADIKVLIRNPDKLFDSLISVLGELKKKDKILNFQIFSPIQKLQSIEIGGLSCWNFLDEEARSTGRWPLKGWRMKKHAKKADNGSYTLGQPRAALVVRIDYSESEFGYWIEIEQKSTSYRSPYINNVPKDPYELVEHLLEVIARTSARNLVPDLREAVSELKLDQPPIVHGYKHGYVKKSEGEISAKSVYIFLKKCHTPASS